MRVSCIVKCPYCGEKILKQEGDTTVLKDRVTLFKGGRAISICRRCRKRVEVPVRISG